MRKLTRKQTQAAAIVVASGVIGGAVGAAAGVTVNLFVAPSRPTPGQARFASEQAQRRTALLRAMCDLDKHEKIVLKAIAKVAKYEAKGNADKVAKAVAKRDEAWAKYCKIVDTFDRLDSEVVGHVIQFAFKHGFANPYSTEGVFEQPETAWEQDAETLIEEAVNAVFAPENGVPEEAPEAEEVQPAEPEAEVTPEPQVSEEDGKASPAPTPLDGGQRKTLPTEPLSNRQKKRIAARERTERRAAERAAKEQQEANEKLLAEAVAAAGAKEAPSAA